MTWTDHDEASVLTDGMNERFAEVFCEHGVWNWRVREIADVPHQMASTRAMAKQHAESALFTWAQKLLLRLHSMRLEEAA